MHHPTQDQGLSYMAAARYARPVITEGHNAYMKWVARVARPGRTSLASSEGRGGVH